MNETIFDLDLLSKAKSRLQRIVNVLILNASFIDSIGLLNGKTGISIFFYEYGRYTGNRIYTDYAGELIDEIYEEIAQNTPLNFAGGLIGIGWGIEYLVKNKFVVADTDEALADIDNAVYRGILSNPLLLESENDLFGYGHYCLSRLRGHENDDDNLTTLIKKEHLIYLIDECERLLVHKRYLEFNILQLSVATINSLLCFLLEAGRKNLSVLPGNSVESSTTGNVRKQKLYKRELKSTREAKSKKLLTWSEGQSKKGYVLTI